jgi:hypothetical protein
MAAVSPILAGCGKSHKNAQKILTLYRNVIHLLPVPDALPSRRLCVRGVDVQQHARHSYLVARAAGPG